MAQRDAPVSLRACAIRIARCNADGSTPAGATNGYITRNFSRVQYTPDVVAGQDFSGEKDACGGFISTFRDRDLTIRYNLELEVNTPDPEIEELLTGAPLITGKYSAPRTVTDGAITTSSTTFTSATASFTTYDVGATIAGTGIPSSTTIVSITSSSVVEMSAAATASSSSVSTTITQITASLGNTAPALGISPTDNGVSLEIWTNAVTGSYLAPYLPYFHWAFPRTFWQITGNRVLSNARLQPVFSGFAVENPLWGNGPWNDWALVPGESTPSTHSLSRAWGRFRANDLPTVGNGYATVPAQV